MRKEMRVCIGVISSLLVIFTLFVAKTRKDLRDLTVRTDAVVSKYAEEVERLTLENNVLKQQLNVTDIPTYSYTREDIYLLAQCAEAEAGVNNSESQRYVAQVILNRLKSGSFPNNIRDIIYEKNNGVPQFSVAYNGMLNREVSPKTLANIYDVIVHGTDLPDYVHFFYSSKVTGNWVNTLPIYKTVEGTVFAYSEKG